MADQTDTTATSTTIEPAPTGGASDAGATQTPAAVDPSGEAADATVLGSAAATDGAGDATGADSKTPPSPTPVPDDEPETYELKLTTTNEAGEEVATDLDPQLVEIATPLLKDAKLSNEQANKLLPLVPQIQERVLAQMNDEFAQTRANWSKEAQADPEIGGKNWTDTQRLAAKALDHFTGPAENNEFRKLLNESGLGNHPAMIRAWRAVGEAISEDGTFTRNTTITETKKSREETAYPDDVPKS